MSVMERRRRAGIEPLYGKAVYCRMAFGSGFKPCADGRAAYLRRVRSRRDARQKSRLAQRGATAAAPPGKNRGDVAEN
jgi:hypothetical protein